MQKVQRPLLVLHEDRAFKERLSVVARAERLEIRTVAGWDELFDRVRSVPSSPLIVVDPYTGAENSDDPPSIELSSLLNRFPSLSVVAALAIGPGRMRDVLRLGQWGVVQIIDLDADRSPLVLAQRLMGARGRPLRGLVERTLPSYPSATARAILNTAATIVAEGGDARDLATALQITPRTLCRRCHGAGLPPPKRLLAWMRILLAAELLDDPERAVTTVAASCGYAADNSLRLAVRRFTGMSPTELRAKGAFGVAAAKFVVELAEAYVPQEGYRTPR